MLWEGQRMETAQAPDTISGLARAILRRSLEADLMQHAEANQRGQHKADSDGDIVHAGWQPMTGGRYGMIAVERCHDSFLSFWFAQSWGGLERKEKAHISRLALDTWAS